MSEQNRQVAIKFVESMGRNDTEGVRECFAPEGVAIAKGTTRFAGARTLDMILDGIEAFKHMMPEGLNFTIKTATAEGDRVVVEAEGNAVTSDGTPYCNQYVFVVTLKEGKIVQANEYFCTKLADDVLWPVAQKMGALAETQA